jgi:thiol:disulfide interchange protein
VSWLERVAILAPVIVLAVGAVAGLVVLWTKVGWETLNRQSHPWRIVAVGLAALCVLFALSLLGIKLPRE